MNRPRRVKSIMNHAYQTMASKLRTKEEFERTEILALLLATIKVDVCDNNVVIICTFLYWRFVIDEAGSSINRSTGTESE